jgi:hypothetical protein
MNRRTRERLSTQKMFDEVVFSSIDWPWKTVRLERDTLQDYCQRPASAIISVAELYHENSKLFPQRVPELAVTRVESDKVRRQFLQRRSSTAADAPAVNLAPECRRMLSAVTQQIPTDLFYAIELRLAAGDMLLFHEPISDKLQLLKRISADEQTRLRNALRLLAPSGEREHTGPVLLVVGNFARNDLLFGSRGYRRTLIDAGRVTEGVLGIARQAGRAARVKTEFTDRDVDVLVEADGVEEGVVIAIELGSANDVI